MPDAPDDYGLQPTTSIDNMSDVGELAARLFSPVNLYRTGSVIFIDDCSKGVAPYELISGSIANKIITKTDHAYVGGFSTRVELNDTSGFAAAVKRTSFIQSPGNIGFFVPITLSSGDISFSIAITFFNGSKEYEGLLQFDQGTQAYTIRGGDFHNHVIVSGGLGAPTIPVFNPIKLVINPDTGFYHYLYIGGLRYDISQYTLLSDPTDISAELTTSLTFSHPNSITGYGEFGAYVVTVGEP